MERLAAVVSRACQMPDASNVILIPEEESAICAKVAIMPRIVPSSPRRGTRGTVIRRGTTSEGVHESIGFELALESNPEFTGSVLTAMARAVALRVRCSTS